MISLSERDNAYPFSMKKNSNSLAEFTKDDVIWVILDYCVLLEEILD